MSVKHRLTIGAVVFGIMLAGTGSASAQTPDLTRLSIEDLLNTEITSVSLKDQTLSRTAAAVHVITQEDIRRSGAKTIPDLLRLVPGVSVAQIDATSWAVSARGFNGLYANKLLVLIDGRNVYVPLLGGVYWDMQNVPLQSIERIEVIRGPGGTLWGANAINGVINIITKAADQAQGGTVVASGGTLDQKFGEVHYGGRLGSDGHYRMYGKYAEQGSDLHAEDNPEPLLDGLNHPDTATVALGGVRFDWRREVDTISIHGIVQDGDGRHARVRPTASPPWSATENKPVTFTDGSVLTSWSHAHSSRERTDLQTSYQDYARLENGLRHRWHTADIELRRRQAIGRRHEFVAGLGYRFTAWTVENSERLAFLPAEETTHLFTGFLQDEIELTSRLYLTIGSKIEHNPYTAIEVQPTARATWMPARRHALWAAVTRAVRTPAKVDRMLQVIAAATPGPDGVPLLVTVEGSPDYQSEDVDAVEGGYRWNRGATSIDVSSFWNGYDRLRGLRRGAMRTGVYEDRTVRILPRLYANAQEATTYGAEVSGSWRPLEWWKASASYAWLHLSAPDRDDGLGSTLEGPVPEHHFHVRTYLDLPGNLEAGALLFGASANETLSLDPYRKVDLTLRWRASSVLELSVLLQNLGHGEELEFVDVAAPVSIPVRSRVLGELAWRF